MQGIGIDIIEIDRIAKAIQGCGQKFLDRIFTPKEQKYCLSNKFHARNFAGRFAAKEAIAKALGVGIGKHLRWLDMEILNDTLGKPYVTVKNKEEYVFHISISHSKKDAIAMAIIEQKKC